MERKLAEFRARQQAKKAAQSQTAAALRSREETAEGGDDDCDQRAAAERPKHTEEGWGERREGGQTEECADWLTDSALGRWLASQQFVVSNLTLLKVMLWLVLLGLFVELEFGLLFFLISLFYWIYEGLRSPAPRQPGEMSAYSVFNPDCQPLLGSLTAEQLEGEMGYRPLANR
ncbi:SAYSvFN domain-containing protein 1 [Pholidichthys leucotaenia]